jgi:polyhydroxyalkanoate synthesis regulator phasin
MPNGAYGDVVRNRGLLTKGDREALAGNLDVEHPEQRLADLRYNVRQRMENMEQDLDILRETGHDDLADEFHQRFGQVERLERRVRELEERLEDADE